MKALHESFKVLSEIITIAINNIISSAELSNLAYERINTLMNNQHLLATMNKSLEDLGKNLKRLKKTEQTNALSRTTVDGLDILLLILKDLANEYTEEDRVSLKKMTATGTNCFFKIRESYLGRAADLDSDTKALLLSSINQMDRLRGLFGAVAENYKKLAFLKVNQV